MVYSVTNKLSDPKKNNISVSMRPFFFFFFIWQGTNMITYFLKSVMNTQNERQKMMFEVYSITGSADGQCWYTGAATALPSNWWEPHKYPQTLTYIFNSVSWTW